MTAARVSFSNWSPADDPVDRRAAALETALTAARTASPVR
jgi:hypothetical protein